MLWIMLTGKWVYAILIVLCVGVAMFAGCACAGLGMLIARDWSKLPETQSAWGGFERDAVMSVAMLAGCCLTYPIVTLVGTMRRRSMLDLTTKHPLTAFPKGALALLIVGTLGWLAKSVAAAQAMIVFILGTTTGSDGAAPSPLAVLGMAATLVAMSLLLCGVAEVLRGALKYRAEHL